MLQDLIAMRLQAHLLLSHSHRSPEAVVAHMGALQAQDYHAWRWAVGLRLPGSREALVVDALNEGRLIRTHLLRPTWHLVCADDVRWLLRLTGAHIRAGSNARHRGLGLDAARMRQAEQVVRRALSDHPWLERPALVQVLEREGFDKGDNLMAHVLMLLELDEVICNGPVAGKQVTYALMDGKVPQLASFDRDAALVELALRYFKSHGPATAQDFAWWSGLRAADLRQAMEGASPELEQHLHGDSTLFWHKSVLVPKLATRTCLLPAFDEFLVAYQDRSAVLEAQHHKATISANGVFWPVILHEGKAAGLWKKETKKQGVEVIPSFWNGSAKLPAKAWDKAVQEVIAFYR